MAQAGMEKQELAVDCPVATAGATAPRIATRFAKLLLGGALALVLGFGLGAAPAQAKGGAEITPKVIGGTLAPNGSWPSQAALLSSSVSNPSSAQFCGGTLIDKYWVLTAAHCVTDGDGVVAPASAIQVAIGINNLAAITSSDRIGLVSIRVIPSWNPANFQWDFALLELRDPSGQPTMEMITPSQAALTAASQPAGIAGWGCTSQSGGNCNLGGYPNDLIEANVSFVSDALCGSGSSYGGSFVPAIMICAGNFSSGTPDTCYGDSGGPLVAFAPGGQKVLAGLTSWGRECALPNYPGVYARVLAGRDWINSTIEENLRLQVSKSGTGSGTVTSSPAGISCGSSCFADFVYGTTVTLTADADSGSGFKGWSGACSGTGSCEVTVRTASQVSAEFEKGPTVSFKARPASKTSKRTATFKFKSSKSGSTFKCQLNGKNWGKCSSPKTYRNLKRGRKQVFRVKATKSGITGPIRKYTWYVTK